jgi:hypothetical protein
MAAGAAGDEGESSQSGSEGGDAAGMVRGGSVFIIKISDAAFQEAMRAIYVQSLELKRVQSMRRAAVVGLRSILGFDRERVLDLLGRHEAGWHRGDNIFYIQLSRDEAELLKDAREIIAGVDPSRKPETLAETLALGFCAGADGDAIRTIIDANARRRKAGTSASA